MRDIDSYAADYIADYGFEKVMVRFRAMQIIDHLRRFQAKRVLEVGCGAELLYGRYLRDSDPVAQWTIVEPTTEFSQQAQASALPNLEVIQGTIELAATALAARDQSPDVVVCSSLLHEVEHPHELLAAIASTMGPQTILHLNVPNAESLHRELAVSMGVLTKTGTLTARNIELQQQAVYSPASLAAAIEAAGLDVFESGGYFVKPFTHAQMEEITDVVDDSILVGLFRLGQRRPEIASEIFVLARRGPSQ